MSRESRFSLLYAVPAASAAQTEFHYQYGKLANPFARTRHFTDILAVQSGVELVPGDSIVFIDILEDSVADGFNDLEFYGEWYPTLSFGRLADRTVGGGPVRDVALIGGINFDGDATDSFMFDVSSGAVSISRASRSGSPRQPIAAGTWVDPGQRAGGGRLGEPCI